MTNRRTIYYWKCDRPSAFHALGEESDKMDIATIGQTLEPILEKYFGRKTAPLQPGGGQGNHITFIAENNYVSRFVRIENGPEGDDFMEIEAHVSSAIRSIGVPGPEVYLADSTRRVVPFAFQVLEYLPYSDLNNLYKQRRLDLIAIGEQIGMNVAKWQQIKVSGFGPFDPHALRQQNELIGLHATYRDYFMLNWDRHLDFLVEKKFLQHKEAEDLRMVVLDCGNYLEVEQGCLVHKDLALWNILGEGHKVRAFIDWDDTISGDVADDISLLACFHSSDMLESVIAGYKKISALPANFLPRFWLHLIRNMVVKAVIRVGANYFDRQSDFFLINSGSDGENLRQFTRQRIETAFQGLRKKKLIRDL